MTAFTRSAARSPLASGPTAPAIPTAANRHSAPRRPAPPRSHPRSPPAEYQPAKGEKVVPVAQLPPWWSTPVRSLFCSPPPPLPPTAPSLPPSSQNSLRPAHNPCSHAAHSPPLSPPARPPRTPSRQRFGDPASSLRRPSKDLTSSLAIEGIRRTLAELRDSLGDLPWADGAPSLSPPPPPPPPPPAAAAVGRLCTSPRRRLAHAPCPSPRTCAPPAAAHACPSVSARAPVRSAGTPAGNTPAERERRIRAEISDIEARFPVISPPLSSPLSPSGPPPAAAWPRPAR